VLGATLQSLASVVLVLVLLLLGSVAGQGGRGVAKRAREAV